MVLIALLLAGAAVRVVTLDQALAAAASAPEVIVARANESVAVAEIRSAKIPGEPSLSIATRTITAKESVSVSIPFRWGGQRSAAIYAAEAGRDAASRSREAAMADARRACSIAWYRLASAEDRLRLADEMLARAERNRRAVADLFELQRASRLDDARSNAEAALATASRASAEQAVIASSAALRALLGIEAGRLSAGDTRPAPPAEGALEAWSRRAHAVSPDLAVAGADLRAAEARVASRARDRLPSTSLAGGADWNDPTQMGTDATLGLSITFPTRSYAALAAAKAERDRAAAMVELARRRVDAELETAWSATAAARMRFETLDGVARPAAAEAAELTRVGYLEGKLDLFRLLDAERALAEAASARADAYFEWGAAFADLSRLAPEVRP